MRKTGSSSIPKTTYSRPRGDLLSLAQVQSILGVKSRKTILKYISDGRLPAYKLGGTRWRFSEKDIKAFLESNRIYKANSNNTLNVN